MRQWSDVFLLSMVGDTSACLSVVGYHSYASKDSKKEDGKTNKTKEASAEAQTATEEENAGSVPTEGSVSSDTIKEDELPVAQIISEPSGKGITEARAVGDEVDEKSVLDRAKVLTCLNILEKAVDQADCDLSQAIQEMDEKPLDQSKSKQKRKEVLGIKLLQKLKPIAEARQLLDENYGMGEKELKEALKVYKQDEEIAVLNGKVNDRLKDIQNKLSQTIKAVSVN